MNWKDYLPAFLRRWLGTHEHARIDAIMAPLTNIHNALADLERDATAAADRTHAEATALRERAFWHDNAAEKAAGQRKKLAGLLP